MGVLLTDPNYKHTLGIARDLSKKGYKVGCIGPKYSLCRFSKYVEYHAISVEDRSIYLRLLM